MLHGFTLLLALDPFQWGRVIIPIVFLALWLLNQLFGLKQGAKIPPVAKRPNAPRPGNNPAGRPPVQPPKKPDALSAEIEQFLKEAAQRKRDKGRREPVRTINRPATRGMRPAAAEVPVDIVPLEPPTGEAVSAAVKRNLDTREFATRASHLADDIKRSDVEREQHFQRTFSHKIGRLTDTSRPQEETAAPAVAMPTAALTAGNLTALLADPQNIRQAIVLNEILSRPEHRW